MPVTLRIRNWFPLCLSPTFLLAKSTYNSLAVDVGGVLVVQHVVEVCHLPLLVADDGELDMVTAHILNVLDPTIVAVDGVGRQSDQLDATLGEFGLELGESAEFGGADGSVILGVREEDDPVVADEFVEINVTRGGLGLEVGGNGAETERLGTLFGRHI